MKTTSRFIILILLFVASTVCSGAIKYYDDYPLNTNPPSTFKLSIQTVDKSVGGVPYNYMTLGDFVDWLGVNGFTNGSGTIIVTNASFQYITNLYAYLTNIFSTNIITTNLFATFESITYATNVTLSVSNFSYTISKGGSLISTNTSFFTTNIVDTTINTNNTFENNTFVTNIVVESPGSLSNSNATPKTAAWWDANFALQSIPNSSGVFTNDGSGGIGWSSTFSLTELDVQNFYPTNTFFLTNFPPAAPTTYGQGYLWNSNGVWYAVRSDTNTLVWTSTNIVAPFPGSSGSAGGVLSGTYPNPGFGSFSSSTLATALTDETGTGLAVFNSSPVLTTPFGSGINFTNSGYGLPTNNIGGGALVFGGPGTAATLYDTNITAATTLKLFDITACGATAGGIKLYVTCSGGTDRILTFPAGCSGAGYGTPPAITITNAKAAFIDIIYKPGATPVTNVFWSPVY